MTADHGNADCLIDEKGTLVTSHTTNPVPFIVCKKDVELVEDGNLGDIATSLKKEFQADFSREDILSRFLEIFEDAYLDLIR